MKSKCNLCGGRYPNIVNHIEKFHPSTISKSSGNLRIKSQRGQKKSLAGKKRIVVDGNNVAHSGDKGASFDKLEACINYLLKKNYNPTVIVARALRYRIKQSEKLIDAIDRGVILEAEPGLDDDCEIIERAMTLNCPVLTNDSYTNHRGKYSHVSNPFPRLQRFNYAIGKFKFRLN